MTTLNCTRTDNDGDGRAYFRHDCEACHFLGSLVNITRIGDAAVEDVYLHGDRVTGSLICRTGNEPGDNASLPVSFYRQIAGREYAGSYPDAAERLKLLDAFYTNVRPARHYTPAKRAIDFDAPFTVLRSGSIFHADQRFGGRYRCVSIVQFPDTYDLNAARDVLQVWFPSTHCTHSYDCCGHYYAYGPKVTKLSGGRFMVSQTFNQNV